MVLVTNYDFTLLEGELHASKCGELGFMKVVVESEINSWISAMEELNSYRPSFLFHFPCFTFLQVCCIYYFI